MAIKLKLDFIKLDALFKLTLLQRVLVLVGANVFIVAGMYYFLIMPGKDRAGVLRGELDAINVKLNDSRTIAADIDRYKREMVDLEAKLNKAIMQLPNEKEIPELIKSVSDAAGDVGMKILLFRPRKEVSKGFYAEVPVDMTVEGGFESLFSFCDKVGRFPRIVNIAGISTMTKTERAHSPMLESKFVVTTFRFIPEGAGKAPEKKEQ